MCTTWKLLAQTCCTIWMSITTWNLPDGVRFRGRTTSMASHHKSTSATAWCWSGSRKPERQLLCCTSFLLCGNNLCSMWCCCGLDLVWQVWISYKDSCLVGRCVSQTRSMTKLYLYWQSMYDPLNCYQQWLLGYLERDISLYSWFLSLYQSSNQWLPLSQMVQSCTQPCHCGRWCKW